MKKILYFFILIFFFINCKKYSPKFDEFNGVNYCFLGKSRNNLIYIDNIKKYSDEEILKFSYCLASEFNINYISINSEIYYITALGSTRRRGVILYKITFETVDISELKNEVILQSRVKSFEKSADGVHFKEVDDYKRTFDCLE